MADMFRRFLQWLLFVENSAPATPQLPTADSIYLLSIFLRKAPGISSRDFDNFLATKCVPPLWNDRKAWGIASIDILKDASWGGILCLPLQFTRCYGFTRALCWIRRKEAPPRYSTRFGALYDSVIEVTFTRSPAKSTLNGLLAALRASTEIRAYAAVASELQSMACRKQTVEDASEAIRLCFLIHRPTHLKRDECQQYWRVHHAGLVLRNWAYIDPSKYLQILTVPEEGDWYCDNFDGIAYAEKPSLRSAIWQLLKVDSLRFNNTLVLDELNFTVDTPVLLLKTSARWNEPSGAGPS